MPDDVAQRANSARLNAVAAVENGGIETNLQLLSGFPFSYNSDERSAQQWIDATIEDLQSREGFFDDRKLLSALRALRVRFDHIRLEQLIKIATVSSLPDIVQRAVIYSCFRGGLVGARSRVAAMCLAACKPDAMDAPFYLATAIGLATSGRADSMAAARNSGFRELDKITETASKLRTVAAEPKVSELDDDDHDEFMRAVAEDRAEFFGSGTTDSPLRVRKKARPDGVMVVPARAIESTGHRRDVAKAVEHIAGKVLPLVDRPNVVVVAKQLNERFPWAASVTDILMRDLAAREHAFIRPTLLLSEPGCGKSTYARAVLDACGLVNELLPLSGVADSALMGTSSQWSSARPSDALRLVGRARSATVGIVLDEVDKSKSSHNGSAVDALLPFLERSTAKALRDPALEVEVDLSWVTWLATANDLTLVPKPLRDRLRIIRMPSPGMQHIGIITRRIIEDIAADRGEHLGFIPPLAQDEIEILRSTWISGSIRQLRQILEILLAGRQQHQLGRC